MEDWFFFLSVLDVSIYSLQESDMLQFADNEHELGFSKSV